MYRAPMRCHTHSSVRLAESSRHLRMRPGWLLVPAGNTSHVLTCIPGFADITPCNVIISTGCVLSVCGYRTLSGCERWDKDMTRRVQSCQQTVRQGNSVCKSFYTCTWECTCVYVHNGAIQMFVFSLCVHVCAWVCVSVRECKPLFGWAMLSCTVYWANSKQSATSHQN